METIIVVVGLLVVGLGAAFSGYPLFRIFLPILGFVAGFSLAFSAVQGLFGPGVWSAMLAILPALILGLVLALISYLYYTVGVIILGASLVAAAFAYIGQAVGLREDGFLVLLLTITGAIIGGIVVATKGLQDDLVIYVTAIAGSGLVLLAAFLTFGHVHLGDLYHNGILRTIGSAVDSSWIWLFAWIGGAAVAVSAQRRVIAEAYFGSQFSIPEEKKNNKK